MGRPKLYKTDEERRAAARARSAEYYKQKRALVCEKKRLKYKKAMEVRGDSEAQKRKAGRPRAALLTDEEQALKNRLKSAQYYQRKKSEIKSRRQNGRVHGRPPSTSEGYAKRKAFRSLWEKKLEEHATRLPELMGKETLQELLERLARRYIKRGDATRLDAACKPFHALFKTIEDFQGELYNEVGAGAEVYQVQRLMSEVYKVIYYIEDLEMLALGEGRGAFLQKYLRRQISYQVDDLDD